MLRFTVLIILFFSFLTNAGQYSLSQNATFSTTILVPAGTICGSNIEECLGTLPASINNSSTGNVDFNKTNQSGVSVSGTTSTLTVYYRKYNKYSAVVGVTFRASFVDDGFDCSSNDECFFLANKKCNDESSKLKNFQYISPGNYPYECASDNPDEDCENDIIAQCASQLGSASYSYVDDGSGNYTCSGMCNDGTAPQPKEECNLANNYCDVADTPSDLDFGSGNAGTDGSSSSDSTTDKDPENDIDYDPDGSGSSASENGGMSSLQGDKLINEVVKSRNDNTDNLASTTDTTNQTIVEKSDDIQETISNSANGIIDAINNDTPFYDGNIVDAINGIDGGAFDDTGIIGAVNSLGTGIEGLGDKIDDLGDALGGDYIGSATPVDFGRYTNIFHGQADLEALTNNYKQSIGVENRDFMNTVKDKFTFSSGSGSYQANNLDLGKWGSHDISIARFVDYFGGVGNIIYFLAALTALTIVLSGGKS